MKAKPLTRFYEFCSTLSDHWHYLAQYHFLVHFFLVGVGGGGGVGQEFKWEWKIINI